MPVEELIPYIDWSPFFISWDLHGKYPAILTDDVVGEAATKLFEDAQEMLQTIVAEKWLEPKGVYGFFPAQKTSVDDITLHDGTRLHFLRQQSEKRAGEPNRSLADFVRPDGRSPRRILRHGGPLGARAR